MSSHDNQSSRFDWNTAVVGFFVFFMIFGLVKMGMIKYGLLNLDFVVYVLIASICVAALIDRLDKGNGG